MDHVRARTSAKADKKGLKRRAGDDPSKAPLVTPSVPATSGFHTLPMEVDNAGRGAAPPPARPGRQWTFPSQLTLLQHIIIQSPFLKQPVQFLADIPKYWLEDDGTMCLDDSHRWKSNETIAWLRTRGLHSVPNSIKAEIGDLVYNGPKKNSLNETEALAPPPGRFVYFTGSRASNDPPPGL